MCTLESSTLTLTSADSHKSCIINHALQSNTLTPTSTSTHSDPHLQHPVRERGVRAVRVPVAVAGVGGIQLPPGQGITQLQEKLGRAQQNL